MPVSVCSSSSIVFCPFYYRWGAEAYDYASCGLYGAPQSLAMTPWLYGLQSQQTCGDWRNKVYVVFRVTCSYHKHERYGRLLDNI